MKPYSQIGRTDDEPELEPVFIECPCECGVVFVKGEGVISVFMSTEKDTQMEYSSDECVTDATFNYLFGEK